MKDRDANSSDRQKRAISNTNLIIAMIRRRREKITRIGRHVCRGTCVRIPGRIIKLEDSKGLIDETRGKRRRMTEPGTNSVIKLITPLALNRTQEYQKRIERHCWCSGAAAHDADWVAAKFVKNCLCLPLTRSNRAMYFDLDLNPFPGKQVLGHHFGQQKK